MRRSAGDHSGERTERGLDRLVNFADATVAIAITVLVLPLVDLAAQVQQQPMAELLSENRGAVIGFTVTFFVIARLWVTHHRIYEAVNDYDDGLVWWSFLWLFAIVLLPFAANALSNLEGTDDAVYAFYIGTILGATVTMVGTEVHLRRHPELLRPEAPSIDITIGIVMSALSLLALVLAVTVADIGLWALTLLLLTGPTVRAVAAVRTRGDRPSPT